MDNPRITPNPLLDNICICSTAEVQERMHVLQERLGRVEGELEDGQEERSEKFAELRSKEQMIEGCNMMDLYILHACTCVYE